MQAALPLARVVMPLMVVPFAPWQGKKYADFEAWNQSRQDGAKEYEAIWKQWKGS